MVPDQPQQALLFMPDISGFTQFVNDTEILHSQQIIQELLETLIECNQLGLQVCEIEGDAIFFYKLGTKPDMNALLKQVETMFTRFHQHIRLFEQQRFCPCAACNSAMNLTLKVFSHFGEVTGISVKDHKKLFGKDVILIHRLMKNNLDKKEYVLLTDPVVGDSMDPGLPRWYSPQQAVENYDVGQVQFYFSDLSHLHNEIPVVTAPKYNTAANTFVAFTLEKTYNVPIKNLFGAIYDLPQRVYWMDGVKGIEMVTNDHVHRIGTKHRCILEKDRPVIVTESITIGLEKIELVEMAESGVGGCHYTVTQISENESKLSVEMLVKNNLVMKVMFNTFMKAKHMKSLQKSLENLEEYIKRYMAKQPEKEEIIST